MSDVEYSGDGTPVSHCVGFPELFTFYTNDCRAIQPVIWFLDKTIILSLLYLDDCFSVYHREIETYQTWCDSHHLILHTVPVRLMGVPLILWEVKDYDLVVIYKNNIDKVHTFKYFCIIKWNSLSCRPHLINCSSP